MILLSIKCILFSITLPPSASVEIIMIILFRKKPNQLPSKKYLFFFIFLQLEIPQCGSLKSYYILYIIIFPNV